MGDFPALQSIGYFQVNHNDALISLGGFPMLVSIGSGQFGGSILVERNARLQDCCVLTEFLRGGTNAVSGRISIRNNATGCSSEAEINACMAQTIAFTSTDSGNVGVPITLVATASSGLTPVTFAITSQTPTSGTGDVATLAAGVLTLVSPGKVTITATQAGGNSGGLTYPLATEMQIITVSKQTQDITFSTPSGDVTGTVGNTIALAAMASSGLNVSFAISPAAGVARLTDAGDGTGTLTLTGEGTVTVTASQGGDATYQAATDRTRTIMVSKQAQAITFNAPSGNVTGTVGNTISLAAMASSGLNVSFDISPATGVARLTDAGSGTGTLTLTGAGTVTVTASQGGDATYQAAVDMTRTITVEVAVGTQPQTIDFTLADTGNVGDGIALAATATSTLAVTFEITAELLPDGSAATAGAVATLMGTTLTLTGEGTVTVTASQGGDDTYAAAPDVTRTITVEAAVSTQPQTIDFTLADTGNVGDGIALAATATSTLAVTFAITAELLPDGSAATAGAVATLMGTTLTLTGEGTVTVTASQGGDDTYVAAPDVTRTITVGSVLGIEDAADDFVLYPNPTSGKLHFSERVGQFRLYGIEGRLLETRKNVRSVDLSARPAGLYFAEVVRDGRSVRWRVVRE